VRLFVPDLHDDVIALRPPVVSDVDAITAAVQDPDIPAFTMVPTPYTAADAVSWVEGTATSWRDGTAAPFVIVDRTTGKLLGAIGVHNPDEKTGRAEVGYWVLASARGRGVASRALGLVAGWALDTVGLARLEALVFVENERSHRVAARAGFARGGVAQGRVEHQGRRRDVVVWSYEAS
jgi:[ribosomal protein S5]-alanine N-acetyltransferase